MDLSLVRRTVLASDTHDFPAHELPQWLWMIVLLDLILFLPIILVLSYTLKTVYPVFAMIEDEQAPAYYPLSLSDGAGELPNSGPHTKTASNSNSSKVQVVFATSSLRTVNRLLMTNGGIMANLRGLSYVFTQSVLTSLFMGVFTAVFSAVFTHLATLLASLAFVQLSTAWVHAIISRTSPLPLWQRLPPFQRTFEATWRPVTISWMAFEIARWLSLALAAIIGLTMPRHPANGDQEAREVDMVNCACFAKILAVLLTTLLLYTFLVIPANVVLVRVQASLLSADQDTIISLDRSLQSKAEPDILGGGGYVSVSDAWATFSIDAWRRLFILLVKVFLVSSACLALMMAIVFAQAVLIARGSVRIY